MTFDMCQPPRVERWRRRAHVLPGKQSGDYSKCAELAEPPYGQRQCPRLAVRLSSELAHKHLGQLRLHLRAGTIRQDDDVANDDDDTETERLDRSSFFVEGGLAPAPPRGFEDARLVEFFAACETEREKTRNSFPLIAAWRANETGDGTKWEHLLHVYEMSKARLEGFKRGTYCYPGRCCCCGCWLAVDRHGMKVKAVRHEDGRIEPLLGAVHYECDAFEGVKRDADGKIPLPFCRRPSDSGPGDPVAAP